MNFKFYFYILIICELTILVRGANILAFLPVPARSHMYVFKPILEELLQRNHNVLAFVSIPQTINSTNYKEVVVISETSTWLINHDFFPENKDVQTFPKHEVLEMGYRICEDGFKDPEFKHLTEHSENYNFDLILTEIPFYQYSAAILGNVFNAPLIALASHGLTQFDEEYSCSPTFLPYIPDIGLPYGNKMTFLQRFYNTWIKFKSLLYHNFYNIPQHEELIQKYFKKHYNSIEPLNKMLSNISLYLINSHYSLISRPYSPNIIEIGGVHLNPKEVDKVPQDIQQFIDNADQGFIYFSFGSNIPGNNMHKDVLQSFITTFSKIKQRVLWKIELDNVKEFPENILVKNWVPQKSILAHKNCLVFITHGGLLSLEEAIWNGVPLIGIPFFGDQPMNMEIVNEQKFGIKINYNNVTTTSLTWAINEIFNDPAYRANIKRKSKVFHDHPQQPIEKAIYWIEYVLRHKGAPDLLTEGRKLSWIKYSLLDVIALMILIIISIIIGIYFILKYLIMIFRANKKENYIKKKNS